MLMVRLRSKAERKYRQKRKLLQQQKLKYRTVGEAIDDNPECNCIAVMTLYEDDIYLGPIQYMPITVRDRIVKRADLDERTLLLIT